MRAGAVVAQRLDLAQTALTGEPVTLADGVATDARWRSGISVASTGLVAYRAGGGSQRQLTWVDRSGSVRGTSATGRRQSPPSALTPDGRRVVVARSAQGNVDLWLLDGIRASRITFDAARDDFQLLSPDGTVVVFLSCARVRRPL